MEYLQYAVICQCYIQLYKGEWKLRITKRGGDLKIAPLYIYLEDISSNNLVIEQLHSLPNIRKEPIKVAKVSSV